MTILKPLDEEEIQQIQYFHEYKGDVTRWCGWDEAIPRIKQYHPHLLKAIRSVQIANRILDDVVKCL